jgi:hypothetical protein
MKSTIGKILTEMISVVLGILIALWLGNWKENRDDRKFISKVLFSVSKEMEENQSALEQIVNEHQELVDTIQFYLQSKDVPLWSIVNKTKGLRMVNIKNTSWKSFLNIKMDLVEYNHISLLTSIDESKQNMRAGMDKLFDFIYGNLTATEPVKKSQLMLMVNDLLNTEHQLVELHKEYLNLVHAKEPSGSNGKAKP